MADSSLETKTTGEIPASGEIDTSMLDFVEQRFDDDNALMDAKGVRALIAEIRRLRALGSAVGSGEVAASGESLTLVGTLARTGDFRVAFQLPGGFGTIVADLYGDRFASLVEQGGTFELRLSPLSTLPSEPIADKENGSLTTLKSLKED